MGNGNANDFPDVLGITDVFGMELTAFIGRTRTGRAVIEPKSLTLVGSNLNCRADAAGDSSMDSAANIPADRSANDARRERGRLNFMVLPFSELLVGG